MSKRRCNVHSVRVVNAVTVWTNAAIFSGRIVRCPLGCVVVDTSLADHVDRCALIMRTKNDISEDKVAVTVDGSCVVSIGSKQNNVLLSVAFVHGKLESITAVVAFGEQLKLGVKCTLRIVDNCLDERVPIVVYTKGPVTFTTTLTSKVAVHSPLRWLSATWN